MLLATPNSSTMLATYPSGIRSTKPPGILWCRTSEVDGVPVHGEGLGDLDGDEAFQVEAGADDERVVHMGGHPDAVALAEVDGLGGHSAPEAQASQEATQAALERSAACRARA